MMFHLMTMGKISGNRNVHDRQQLQSIERIMLEKTEYMNFIIFLVIIISGLTVFIRQAMSIIHVSVVQFEVELIGCAN